jgi:MtN3 and saliva related transmembrane protein
MADKFLIDAVGTAAGLCSMTSFLPQLIKIWRERDAEQVSLRMYLVTVTGFTLWITYGFLNHSWPVWASNMVCLGLSGAILASTWWFRRRNL